MPILSKKQVWYSDNPNAHTSGMLFKKDLVKNKAGRIVSKRKHEAGKRMFLKNNLKPKSREEMAEMRAMRRKK